MDWSSINMNLAQISEKVAAVDMEKKQTRGLTEDLLIEQTEILNSSKTRRNKKLRTSLYIIVFCLIGIFVFNIGWNIREKGKIKDISVDVLMDNTSLSLYENPLLANIYENGKWVYCEYDSVLEKMKEIENIPQIAWNDSFTIVIPESISTVIYDLYTASGEKVGRFLTFKEVKEMLSKEKSFDLFLIVNASWDGKYVWQALAYEHFTSEFILNIQKDATRTE